MLIKVNDEDREVPEGTTVADLVADLPHRGVAVAVDGTVVRRADHSATTLESGARVEVVTAVQGG